MGIVLCLREIMYHNNIRTQSELIKLLAQHGIAAPPKTINLIYYNKIKQLPVYLIYGISIVTQSAPADWIKLIDGNNEWPTTRSVNINDSESLNPGVQFLFERKSILLEIIDQLQKFNVKTNTNTLSKIQNGTIKRLPLDLVEGICKLTNQAPGDWIKVVDPNGRIILPKGI
ncbi:hypothetical protein ABE82_26055 (plasmid) [Paenibacillus peoriae]|uniref:hypothetical protein n=1 Tax=Paenibacillus peoriae TaxID=59893 RepID=UPI0007221F6F|nr:hypothetical protein [Paenibacillus peoriae]ALS09885.1 hypothetical protein ABE82_26055 [Paenibacillus peoriae]